MKTSYNGLIFTLLIVFLTTPNYSYTIQQTHTKTIVNKLKKAWGRSNWVKAGTATAACALLYALGNKLFIPACSLATHVGTSVEATAMTKYVLNKKFLWQLLSAIGALSTVACAYAYLNSQDSDLDYVSTGGTPSQEINFDDDFFDFDMAEELVEDVTTSSAQDNQDIIAFENKENCPDVIAFENQQDVEDIVAFENNQTAPLPCGAEELVEAVTTSSAQDNQDIIAFENKENCPDVIAFENQQDVEDIVVFENNQTAPLPCGNDIDQENGFLDETDVMKSKLVSSQIPSFL